MPTNDRAADVLRPRAPWRPGLRVPPWIAATFVAKVLAVVFISFLSYRGLEYRAQNARLTEHTLHTLQQLELVLSLLKDAETGERGYLLTGEERYLEPHQAARASIPTALIGLRQLVTGDSEQTQRLNLLDHLVQEKLDEIAQTVELRRSGNADEAVALVRTDRGKTTMDGIRGLVADMEATETTALRAANVEGNATSITQREITLSGAALLILLIVLSLLASARAFRDLETQSWIRVGESLLAARLQGAQGLAELGDRTASFLATYLDAQVGAVFAADPSGFLRCGAYGLSKEAAPDPGRPAHGLVTQSAKENRILHVAEIPDGYLPVSSGLGSAKPRHLMVVPATVEGEAQAVIELGFFREVGAPETDLLRRAADSIGLTFRAAKDRLRQGKLLEESQRQAEELEEQTQRLKVSQEELEETNAQLQGQTHTLESQKASILEAQQLLQQKNADVERTSRYKSEFLANMSHELRTPLNSSLIIAKLLMDNRDGNLTDEQVRYAQSIYAAGNDLLALINDILDLSKIEAGKVTLSIEPVAVARLFENLKRRFAPVATERKLDLRLSVEAGCPEAIESDAQRLTQVLANLLSNALKFTEKGSVHLHAAPSEGRIAFTVEDTGIGIAAEQHEVIFEAFRQADGTTSRKYGGTGLGLSISRELVAVLGGEIRLRSAPGQGSAFTVLLPLRPESARTFRPVEPAAEAAPPTRHGHAAGQPFVADDRESISEPSRVLLVVEDDPAFAAVLRDLGREQSFQCVLARDAAEALALAHDYPPTAVLLDIALPDQSGLSVLERLKRDPAVRHVPIHVVSAHDYERVARELGAVGYALKPVKREQLIAAFRVLEERLSRQVRSVLVVEDDAVQRAAITDLLKSDRVTVVAVATAGEGLSQLRGTTFDCCVLDLMLPDVSGFDLLERMSADESCSFPPIIIYTARPLTPDEEQRLRRLSSSIIIKGARSPERLLEEVTLFLHQVESELPSDKQRMLKVARDRERIFDGRRLLLVEDDVRNIFALTRALEPKGLVVEIARNGKEALERATQAPAPDVVLMDLMMPEMDGLTATRELRKDARSKSLPIIALTAKAMPDDRQACLAAGANDYIAKPIDLEKLLSLLRVWMPR